MHMWILNKNNTMEVNEMTKMKKNFKRKMNVIMESTLATFAVTMSTIAANSCCVFIYHQPKTPETLKKLRKF